MFLSGSGDKQDNDVASKGKPQTKFSFSKHLQMMCFSQCTFFTMLLLFNYNVFNYKGLGSNAIDTSCSKMTSPKAAAAAMAAHVFPLTIDY